MELLSSCQIERMLISIREEFKLRINTLSWMDEQTKANARIKVNALADHIGYPEFIRSRDRLDKYYEKVDTYSYGVRSRCKSECPFYIYWCIIVFLVASHVNINSF